MDFENDVGVSDVGDIRDFYTYVDDTGNILDADNERDIRDVGDIRDVDDVVGRKEKRK